MGARISAMAITPYVIPYEVAVQTLILVGAVTTVTFPVISNLMHNAPQQSKVVSYQWFGLMACMIFIMLALLANSANSFAEEC